MAVDPATGAILRLMVRAQIKAGEPVSRADLVVEYGAVEIGARATSAGAEHCSFAGAEHWAGAGEMVEQGPHGAAGPGMSLPW